MNNAPHALTDRAHPPVPEPSSPFPYRVSPRVEQARAHLTEWTGRTGLVRQERARERFERADFGWFAAMVYPTASPAHVDLMADWFAWLFLVDDQLDDGAVGRDPEHFGAVVDGMRAVLGSDDFGASAAAPGGELPVAVSSLADLWSRTAPDTTAAWRRRFVRHLEDCLATAAVWEAGNRLAGIVPDEAEYIPRRRHTGAIYVCMDFIDVVERLDVPEDLYGSGPFTDALNAACDVVCWTNDLYSYEKERSLGEVHNLVHIVRHHHALDRDPALVRVRDAVDAETERFLVKERELLRAFPGHAAVLRPYLAGMRSWMRGNLDWSRATKRYQSSDASVRERPQEYLETAVMGVDR
ncbi:terpene cyclase [Streptomyces sp. NPDC004327]|uniref:terpene synthase family protein n=1 Tax=Streptomyces sp. NPDC004327 TaxID=3364699 RepID=UPI0036AE8830